VTWIRLERHYPKTKGGQSRLQAGQLRLSDPPSQSGYCVACMPRSSVRQRSSPTVREGPNGKTEFHTRCDGKHDYTDKTGTTDVEVQNDSKHGDD